MIRDVLWELCEDNVKKGIYKKICDGNSEPISISYKKHTYYYQPDLYAIYAKKEDMDVYEVIDTETEGEAVMDIVYSALTSRINVMCVVCSDMSKLEAIKLHAKIILNKFFNEDQKTFDHIFNPRYFVYVPRNARSAKAIKRQLKKEMDF